MREREQSWKQNRKITCMWHKTVGRFARAEILYYNLNNSTRMLMFCSVCVCVVKSPWWRGSQSGKTKKQYVIICSNNGAFFSLWSLYISTQTHTYSTLFYLIPVAMLCPRRILEHISHLRNIVGWCQEGLFMYLSISESEEIIGKATVLLWHTTDQ